MAGNSIIPECDRVKQISCIDGKTYSMTENKQKPSKNKMIKIDWDSPVAVKEIGYAFSSKVLTISRMCAIVCWKI